MPDLLAHTLRAYTLATLASWRHAWLSLAYVTVTMAGAFIPDLTKISLVLSDSLLTSVLGVRAAYSRRRARLHCNWCRPRCLE